MTKAECKHCHKEFEKTRPYHYFCSYKCKDIYNKGKDWPSYFKSLINNNKQRSQLTPDILFRKYMGQGGKCALSGVQLTKIVGQGLISTNASIDRIVAGGEYSPENTRLVCTFVNSLRGNVTDEEFFWWCEQITEKIKCQKSAILKKNTKNIIANRSKKLIGRLADALGIKWKRQEK